jgi:hypothetical protein
MVCLGIDPDTRYIALAMCSKNEVLAVYSCHIKEVQKDDLEPMIKALRHHIIIFMTQLNYDPLWPLRIIVEGQRIYPGDKIQPNDLIKLAQIGGAAAGICADLYPTKKIIIPEPRQWKGSVPKAIHQARQFYKLGWGYKKTKTYAYPISPNIGKNLKQLEWKHVGDAIGLALWGANLKSL